MYYQKPLVEGQVAFLRYWVWDIGYRISGIGYWLFYNGAGVVFGVVAKGDFGDMYTLTYW